MWRKALTILVMVATAIFIVGAVVSAQVIVQRDDRDGNYDDSNYESTTDDRDSRDYQQDDYDRSPSGDIQVDRYLDVDVWTNHSDNDFYSGDHVVINYRVNRDAYVAIYSIDTRGRVHLLYPTQPGDNAWRHGGITYSLPGPNDDFDLVVNGPDGTENIAVIASRDRFPIPNWYNGAGIICRDRDRDSFLDYLHRRYFMRYDGQRFAMDREVLSVNDWEPDYFRPVYYPTYPNWAVCGNVYVDYPWGGSIYIDGIYWGCAPLYVPTILVGWHTFTVYDPYGYCWENNIHVSRYNTVVLNHTIIRTSSTVVSKYREVRQVGYRDPVRNGYPRYSEVVKRSSWGSSVPAVKSRGGAVVQRNGDDNMNYVSPKKRYVRGSGEVIKTDRGFETPSVGGEVDRRSRVEKKGVRSYQDEGSLDRFTPQGDGNAARTENRSHRPSGEVQPRTYDPTYESGRVEGNRGGGSSDYYQKKSGTVERKQPENSSDRTQVRQKRSQPRGENPSGGRIERTREPERQPSKQVEERRSNPPSRGGEVKQRSSDGGGHQAQPSNPPRGNSENSGGRAKGRR